MMLAVAAVAAGAAFAGSEGVQSSNIVGYYNQVNDGGYHVFCPSLFKVGAAEETLVDDIIDTTALQAYVSEIQYYSPVDGAFYSYYWNGAGWTENFIDTVDIPVAPDEGYMCNFGVDLSVSGEVINGTLEYEHQVPNGYSIFGSAFPAPLKLSNFNFADVMSQYMDEIQIYDGLQGLFISYYWDGVSGFTDFSEYLQDEVAEIGKGVVLGNTSGFSGLVETLN